MPERVRLYRLFLAAPGDVHDEHARAYSLGAVLAFL